MEQGIAGRAYLTTVETAWRRRPAYYAVPWRSRWATELGGPLVNLAIHAHDLVYYLLGPREERVGAPHHPRESDRDRGLRRGLDRDGRRLALHAGGDDRLGAARSAGIGSASRSLSAESNTEPYRNSHDPWTFKGDTPEIDGRIQEALAAFVPELEGYAGQFARYHRALRSGAELPVTLADARASIELITAIYHSARTRAPVRLPLEAGHPLYARVAAVWTV